MDALNTRSDRTAPPAPGATERKLRRLLPGFSVLAALLALVLLAAAISGVFGLVPGLARNQGAPPPKATPLPTSAGLDLTGFHLNSISMVSASEGWAVGSRPNGKPMTDSMGEPDLNAVEPVILHYKDGRWSLDQLPPALSANPNHFDMTLSSISMVSATEGWAVGSTLLPAYYHTIVDGFTFGILLHYTGGKWVQVDNTAILSEQAQIFGFSSVFMRSADDGWMIGSGSVPNQPGQPLLVLHYDGHAWTQARDPLFASLDLQQVTEAPDGEVWITGIDTSKPGFDGDDAAAIIHYDGSRWTREQDTLANDRLMGLAMVSASEGWAVGYTPNGTGPHPAGPQMGLIAHYQNGAWTTQRTVAGPASDTFFSLSAVAMVSASEGWAVGNEGTILHYQHGSWSQVQSPTDKNLESMTMVSPTEGWAMGAGIILHYLNGAWSVYQS